MTNNKFRNIFLQLEEKEQSSKTKERKKNLLNFQKLGEKLKFYNKYL